MNKTDDKTKQSEQAASSVCWGVSYHVLVWVILIVFVWYELKIKVQFMMYKMQRDMKLSIT